MRGSEETYTPITYHQQFPHCLYLYIKIAAGVAARFALLDALLQREIAVFGPSTPGQTRTPNEGNRTPKRDFFSGFR